MQTEKVMTVLHLSHDIWGYIHLHAQCSDLSRVPIQGPLNQPLFSFYMSCLPGIKLIVSNSRVVGVSPNQDVHYPPHPKLKIHCPTCRGALVYDDYGPRCLSETCPGKFAAKLSFFLQSNLLRLSTVDYPLCFEVISRTKSLRSLSGVFSTNFLTFESETILPSPIRESIWMAWSHLKGELLGDRSLSPHRFLIELEYIKALNIEGVDDRLIAQLTSMGANLGYPPFSYFFTQLLKDEFRITLPLHQMKALEFELPRIYNEDVSLRELLSE